MFIPRTGRLGLLGDRSFFQQDHETLADMSEDTVSNIITRTKNDPIFDELFEIFGKEPEPEGLHTPPHCSNSEADYPGTEYTLPSTSVPVSAASVSSSLVLSSQMQQATLSFSTECIDLNSMSGFPDLAVGEHGPQTFSTQSCHDTKTDEAKGTVGQGDSVGNCSEQVSENSVANCENIGSSELGEHPELSEQLLQEQTPNTDSPKHFKDVTPSIPCSPPASHIPAVDRAAECVVSAAHDASRNTGSVPMNTSTESVIISPNTNGIANSDETQKTSPLGASASDTLGRIDTVKEKDIPSHTPTSSIAGNVARGNTSINTEHSYCHSGREMRAPVSMCEDTTASSSSSFPATPDTESLSLHQSRWVQLAMSVAAEETDGADVVSFDGTRYGAVVIRDEAGMVTESQPSLRTIREVSESVSGDQMEIAVDVSDGCEAQTAKVALQPSGAIEVDTGVPCTIEGQKSMCVLGERTESSSTDIPSSKQLSAASVNTNLLSLQTLQSVEENQSQSVPDDSYPPTSVKHDLGFHLASVTPISASVETERTATSTQNFDAAVILQSTSVTQSSCSLATRLSASETQNSVTRNCALSTVVVTQESTLPVPQSLLPSSLSSPLPSTSQQFCVVMGENLVTSHGSVSMLSDDQGHAAGDTRENYISTSLQNSISGTAQHSTVAAHMQLTASGPHCKSSDAATVTSEHPSKMYSSQEVQTISKNCHVGSIQRHENLSQTVKALISPIKTRRLFSSPQKIQSVSLLASQSAHKTLQSPLADGHCHKCRATTSARQTSALGPLPLHCHSSLSDSWPCPVKVPSQLSKSTNRLRHTKSANALELLQDDRAQSISAVALLRQALVHLPQKSFTGVRHLTNRELGSPNQSDHSHPSSRGKHTALSSVQCTSGHVDNSGSNNSGIFGPLENPEPGIGKLVTETLENSAAEECLKTTVSAGAEHSQNLDNFSLASNQSIPVSGSSSVCASSVPQSPCTASQSSSSTPQRVPTHTPELVSTPMSLKQGVYQGSSTITAQRVPCRGSQLLCSHSLLPVFSGQQAPSEKRQSTPLNPTTSQLPFTETSPQTNVVRQPVLPHPWDSVTSKDQQVLAFFPALTTGVAPQISVPEASISAEANSALSEHIPARRLGSGAIVFQQSISCSPLQLSAAVVPQVPPSTPPRTVTEQVKDHTPRLNKSHVTPPSQHTPQRIPPATPPRSGIYPSRRTSPRTPKRTSPFASYGRLAFTSPRRAPLYSPIKSPYSPRTGASITSLFSPRRKRLLNEPIPEVVLEELSRHSDSCFSDVPSSSRPESACGNCEGAKDEENCHNEGNNTQRRLGPFSQVAPTKLPREKDSLSSDSQPRDLHLSCSSPQTASSSGLKNFRVVGTIETVSDLPTGRLITVGDLSASDNEASNHSAIIFSNHVVYQKGKTEEKIGKGTENSKAAHSTGDTVERELSTGGIFISPGTSDDAGRTNISMPILPLAVSQFLDNQIQTGELQVPLDISSDLSLQKTPTKSVSKTTPQKVTPNKYVRKRSPLKKMSTSIGQFASLSRNKTSSARKTSPRKCVTSGIRQSPRKRQDIGEEVFESQKSSPKRLPARNPRKVKPSTNEKRKLDRTKRSLTVPAKIDTLPALPTESSTKKTVSSSSCKKQVNKRDSSESDFSIHTSSSHSEYGTSSDDDLPLSELVKAYSQRSTASISEPDHNQKWTKLQKQTHGVHAAGTVSCLSTANSNVTPGPSQHSQGYDRPVETVQQCASVMCCTIAEDVQPASKSTETLPIKKRLLEVHKLGVTDSGLPIARKKPVAKKNLQLLLNKELNNGRKISSPIGSDADSFDGQYEKESSKMSGTGSSSVEVDVCVLSESENSEDDEMPTSQSERKKLAIIAARRSTLKQKLRAKKRSPLKHDTSPESVNTAVMSKERANTVSPSKHSSESPVHVTEQDKSKGSSKKSKSCASPSVMTRKSPEDSIIVMTNMSTELPVKSGEWKSPVEVVPSVEMQSNSPTKGGTTCKKQTVMPQQHGQILSTAGVAQSSSVGHSSDQPNTAGNNSERKLGPGQLVQTQPFSYTALRQPEAVGIQAFGPHRRITPTLISKTTTSYFPPLKNRMGTRQNGQDEITSGTITFPVFSIFSAPSPCTLLPEVSQGVSSPPPSVSTSTFPDGCPVSKPSSVSPNLQPVASIPKLDTVFNSAQAKTSSRYPVAESTDGKFPSPEPGNPGKGFLKRSKHSSISPATGKKAADHKRSTKSSRRKGVKKQSASSSPKCSSHSVAGKESLDPPHTSDIIDHGLCVARDETGVGNEVNNCQTIDNVETEEAVRALEELQASESYIYVQPIQNDNAGEKNNETDICRDAKITRKGADKYQFDWQSESPEGLPSKQNNSRKRKNSSSISKTSDKRARKETLLQKEQIGPDGTATEKLHKSTRGEQIKAGTGTDDTAEVSSQLLSMPFLRESMSPIKIASVNAERDSEPAPLNVISIAESDPNVKTVNEKSCSVKRNLLGKSGVGKSVETSSISGNSIIKQFSSLLHQVESEKQNNPSNSPAKLPNVEQKSMQSLQEETNDLIQTIQGSRDSNQKTGAVLMNTSKHEQLLEELHEMRSAVYAARTQKRREMRNNDGKQQGVQKKRQRKSARYFNTRASSSTFLQQNRQKVSLQTISQSLCINSRIRHYKPILPKGMEGKTLSDVNASSPPRVIGENPLDAAMKRVLPELAFSPSKHVESNTCSAAVEKVAKPSSKAEKRKTEVSCAIKPTERTEKGKSRAKKNRVKIVPAAVLDDLESPAPLVIDDGVQISGAETSLHVTEKVPQNRRMGGKGKNKTKSSATLKSQKCESVKDRLDGCSQSKDVSAQHLFQCMMDPPVAHAVPVPENENELSLPASDTLAVLAPMFSIPHTQEINQHTGPLTSGSCTVPSYSTYNLQCSHASVTDVHEMPAQGVNNASASLRYANSTMSASGRQVSQMSVAAQPRTASEGPTLTQAQSLPLSVKPSNVIKEVTTMPRTKDPVVTGLVAALPTVARREPDSTALSCDSHIPTGSTSHAATSLHALSSVDRFQQQKGPIGWSTVSEVRASESPRLQAAQTLASIAVLGVAREAAGSVKTVLSVGACGSRSTHKLSKIDRLNGINIDKFLDKKALKLKRLGSEKK